MNNISGSNPEPASNNRFPFVLAVIIAVIGVVDVFIRFQHLDTRLQKLEHHFMRSGKGMERPGSVMFGPVPAAS
jgi:hypothetical protein